MPSGKLAPKQKSQTPSGEFTKAVAIQPSTANGKTAFSLSWSQYVFLLSIENPEERGFYEIEAAENGWDLPELKRQFNSGLYERLALSRDKEGIRKLARKGHIVAKPQDLLKEPYVLEFRGLDEKTKYSESDLESAIIDKLEHFLLEPFHWYSLTSGSERRGRMLTILSQYATLVINKRVKFVCEWIHV